MDNPIIWIAIGILIIIVIREIVCWYWKINERLNEQKKQTKLLEEILRSTNPNSTYFDKKENQDGKYIL